MKITIYELLGLVKDGKAPKKIKFCGNIYEWEDDWYLTKEKNYKVCLGGKKGDANVLMNAFNENVEIIEEDKDIEELNLMFPTCGDIKNTELGGFISIYKSNLINIKYKIEEIIDEINKLKNGSR